MIEVLRRPRRRRGTGSTARRLQAIVGPVAVIVAVIVVALGLGGGKPVSAHASLDSSEPAGFAVLEEAPREVVVRFDEEVEPSFSDLVLSDATGRRLRLGPLEHRDGGRAIAVAVGDLEPGVHVVTWAVVGRDGHRVTGSFAFSLGTVAPGEAREVLAAARRGVADESAVGLLAGIARWWGWAGMVLGVWAWFSRRVTAGIIGAGWVIVGWLGVLGFDGAASVSGRLEDAWSASTWSTMLTTREGAAASVVALGAILLAIRIAMRARRWGSLDATSPRAIMRAEVRDPIAIGAVVAMAVGHGITGHVAAVGGAFGAVAMVSSVVHVLTILGWFAVITTGVAAGRRGGDIAAHLVTPARVFAAGAVITGSVTAAILGDGIIFGDASSWSRLLATKVGLVAVIIGIGIVSARRPHEHRSRFALAELAVGGVVLTVAAVLVATPPQSAIEVEARTVQVVAGGVIAEITVSPAATGPSELHLVMSPPGGTLQPVIGVEVRLEDRRERLAPIPVDMAFAGPNHWSAPVQFPLSGSWQVVVVAEIRPRELVRFTADVDIADRR